MKKLSGISHKISSNKNESLKIHFLDSFLDFRLLLISEITKFHSQLQKESAEENLLKN